jgi:hypothetical protein
MPNYEIKEWNESNFDVNAIQYTSQAYQQGKYAYVSDYARLWILYQYGGIYFDTDVELIKSFADIIAEGAFMGIEQDGANICVAPGLALGAEAGMDIYREIIQLYKATSYYKADGTPRAGLVVQYTTDALRRRGLQLQNVKQYIAGINIYPNDYFNPLDDATGRLTLTANSHSIHHYSKTWADNYGPMRIWATRLLHRCLGVNTFTKLKIFIQR